MTEPGTRATGGQVEDRGEGTPLTNQLIEERNGSIERYENNGEEMSLTKEKKLATDWKKKKHDMSGVLCQVEGGGGGGGESKK